MIRVMVVDDSALVRRIASDILSADPEIRWSPPPRRRSSPC